MKRLLRFFTLSLLASVLLVGISSCSDDGYSLDQFRISMATVKDNGNSYTLDDGITLWVAANNINHKFENERVMLNYTILSDNFEGYHHAIRLNSVAEILTKDPIYAAADDEAKQKELGDDPLKIITIFERGGYLNIEFGMNVSGEGGKHLINLVSAESDLGVSGQEVKLDFRHNANGNSPNYGSKSLVCFRLDQYRTVGRDSVNFKIKVKNMDSEYKVYEIPYKYKIKNNPPKDSE